MSEIKYYSEEGLQKLKDEITALKAQVDGIKSCGCPDNMSQTIQAIKDFMDAMNDANRNGAPDILPESSIITRLL